MNHKVLVLVVASDASRRGYLSHILESAGYQTAGMSSGFRDPGYASSVRPDEVIYDIDDSWSDALTLLRRVHEVSPESRIIGLRERADWLAFFDAIDAGATDLMVRVFTAGQLRDAVALALRPVSA